jgi:Carboxypeptidase regulatory-like domain/TonB dependent receptor
MNRSRQNTGLGGGQMSVGGVLMVIVLLIASLVGALPARAQAVYGSIFGTASDKTGAAIPNATITVTDVAKGISVTVQSNESGLYRVQHLIPDTYTVKADAPGFSSVVVQNIVVYADTSPQVDVHLEVGNVSSIITVTGGAPLLETDRAEVSTILNERAVENLPNFNRNFTAFELMTPGTTYIGWGPGEGGGNPQRSESIEVNGQLPFATGYELDGTDNQDPINGVAIINPNLDSISEMKVTSQNYDAEFGKAVAGLVTAQTKSGSNNFHGTAFEYRRSDAQQARDPFANAEIIPLTGKYLPSTLHNQFGGSIGGPIKKERLFFFGDYQGLREKTGSTTLTTVPTLTAKNTCTSGGACDLSDYLATAQVYKPNSLLDTSNTGRTAYTGNIIPAGDLSAPSINLLKLLPAPNHGATIGGQVPVVNNYEASGSGIFNTNQFDVRIDDRWNDRLHLFGRYTYFSGNLSGGAYFGAAGGLGFGAGGFAGTDAFRYQSLASGGDYIVSPKWLTDFRFAYNRIYNNSVGPDYTQPLGNNLGIPNSNVGDLSLNGGLPQFNISIPFSGANNSQNIEYGTSANPSLQQTAQYQVVNNWSHQAGNHNIKFGVDLRYGKAWDVTIQSNALRSGTFFFAQSRTSGGPTTSQSPGLGYATFLLGDTTTFWRTQTANVNAQSRQTRAFAYAQDQWRMTPKLSVNYGLRWELYTPESITAAGAGGLLNLDTGNVDITGVGSVNSSANVTNNYKEFAPRVGVAYQPFQNVVVRAGYGIVYGQGWAGDSFGNVMTSSFPSQIQQSVNPVSNAAAVFKLQAGPPGYTFPSLPTDGKYALPDLIYQETRPQSVRLPTVQGWNAMVETQLTSTMSLQIGYVGSEAYHNMFESSPTFNVNEETLNGFVNPDGTPAINPVTGQPYTVYDRSPFGNGTAQSQLGVKWGKPFGWSQRIDYAANQATGSYNALQVVLNKRFASGLQFLSHYTWSHAIGHESYEFLVNPIIGKGNGYYNRRHAFVFAGNYDVPFGRDKQFVAGAPSWLNQIIGGFQLNATVTVDGGLPFTAGYNECGLDNDVGNNDGACFLNKVGTNFGIHKGKYDPATQTVPYLQTTATPLARGASFNAFQRPAQAGTWGNLGRDSLWGPGLVNVDSALTKNFNLPENLKMQLTVQTFNLFNHVNLGQPGNCIDCGVTSGTIQGTVAEQDGTSMRRLQFAARFQF